MRDATEMPGTREDVLALIEATPMGDTPEDMRRAFGLRAGPQPVARETRLGDVEALEIGKGPTLLWFHGGGYVFGGPQTHLNLASALASRGLRVVLPRYRLAPEHPWPAALEDALAAFDATGGPVAIGGDSAGGHLALCLALRRPVLALTLISPNTDRTGLSRTRQANDRHDAMVDDAGDNALARLCFGALAPDHPDVSPLLSDLARLPPIWLTAATNEVLLDDALLLTRAAARAGVPVELSVRPGLFHLWPLWPQAIAEGAATLAAAAEFVLGAYAARASNAG